LELFLSWSVLELFLSWSVSSFQLLQQAIAMRSDFIEAYINLGDIFVKLGRSVFVNCWLPVLSLNVFSINLEWTSNQCEHTVSTVSEQRPWPELAVIKYTDSKEV